MTTKSGAYVRNMKTGKCECGKGYCGILDALGSIQCVHVKANGPYAVTAAANKKQLAYPPSFFPRALRPHENAKARIQDVEGRSLRSPRPQTPAWISQ